jgi:hypothetical protein
MAKKKVMLAILTRTFKRPKLLKRNQESLAVQTCQDFNQVLIEDKDGIGIPESHKRFHDLDVDGRYVWLLDDDDFINNKTFVETVKQIIDEKKPDVVICAAIILGKILPDVLPLELAHCGGINIIVSQAVWKKHRNDYGLRYEGDWDFINSVMKDNPSVEYIKEPMLTIDRHSLGLTEEKFNVGDFDVIEDELSVKVGEQVLYLGTAAGTFYHQQDEIVMITEANREFIEGNLRGGIAVKYPLKNKKKE